MKLKIQKYIIKAESTIEDAAKGIEQNASGFIFLENAKSEIIGLVTDGDIRRSLIAGMSLNDLALECSTKKFKYVKPQDEYEKILKLFDEQIAFLPVLDQKRRLVKIIFRDTLAIKDEKPVYIRSRAPVRVSFGGGGSDLTHYFKNSTGAVFNATISIFSHALMKLRVDEKIIIHSEDLNLSITYENLHVAKNSNDEFELIRALIGCVEPEYGFEMYINSDFSLGSGLGGSSTLLVAILGCFNALRLDKWSKKEIAEIAYQAERITLGASGGWQDQYSSVFGGFNFIEFNSFQNNIEPLKKAFFCLTLVFNTTPTAFTKIKKNRCKQRL